MFNAPRPRSAALPSPFASLAIDPLAGSGSPAASGGGYDEVDPWSSAPSPSLSGSAVGSAGTQAQARPVLRSAVSTGVNGDLIPDEHVPTSYTQLYDALDIERSGDVSVTALHRLLSTAEVQPSIVERVVNIVSPSARAVSRQQFFVALGLVALAQQGVEPSIERLATTLPNLPVPHLRSTAPPPVLRSYSSSNSFGGTNGSPAAGWDRPALPSLEESGGSGPSAEPAPDAGSGARPGWWKDVERVDVALIPEKEGWFLTKYRVESDKRGTGPVHRRYSDFVWLLDCLTKRYPFRMLPSLPPKRIGPDQAFLEQRRKSLTRFINFVVNHPILAVDGCVGVFLAEPNFEAWRKRTKVNLDEEATTKRLDPAAEMAIPSDLPAKIDAVRTTLPLFVDAHAKLVVLAEKAVKRLEAAAADESRMAMTLATLGERHADGCYRNAQAAAAQAGAGGIHGTNGVQTRGGCALCEGVGRGLSAVAETWSREGEALEQRTRSLQIGSVEQLKTQRDLYLAFRDLLIRHERLSKDSVDAIRKKVETRQKRLETVRINRKTGWEAEEEKLVSAIEQENTAITNLLARRVFIKHCMWAELSVVMHSRQAAQATLGWRAYAAERSGQEKRLEGLWKGLEARLGDMPVE